MSHFVLAAANSSTIQGVEQVSAYRGMVPNMGFNLSMVIIWGILLFMHIVMLVFRQYWFSVAFICTSIMELIGFIGRLWSHYNVVLFTPFLIQIVCLTIAPVFIMAGIFYQLAKMIEIYGHGFSLLPSPMTYSKIFVAFDVLALIIQAAGGGLVGNDTPDNHLGSNIFITGLSIQVGAMVIFMGLMGHLYYMVFFKTRMYHLGVKRPYFKVFNVRQNQIDYFYTEKFHDLRQSPERWQFNYFPLILAEAVIAVFVRCCYRLAELSEGWGGTLMTNEHYFIILDALMMSIATVALTIFHPGIAFKGRSVSIPITKGEVYTDANCTPNVEEYEIN